jgi:hypothetical protein
MNMHRSAVGIVTENGDLMTIVASFLINKPTPTSLLSSPMLPVVLSFRSLHTRMILELNATHREPKPRLVSTVKDFVRSVEMVKWAKSMGCSFGPNDEKLCNLAARCGALDVIQWARVQDPPCPWDQEICAWAAKNGHLHVLQWARAQDPLYPWDEDTCAWAASNGHLHVLQWARAQNPPCPWDRETCAAAASNGHLRVLQWARAEDPPCPWNEETCAWAAQNGHLDVAMGPCSGPSLSLG